MKDKAKPGKRVVEIPGAKSLLLVPGVIEVRWKSDDPEFYHPPTDLFHGLPDICEKKDKQTTEQSYFTCLLCDCDLKSLKTLSDHCEGTQHRRKALNKLNNIESNKS